MSPTKTLKITPTCFDHQIIIIREFLILVKITGSNLSLQVWLCGSIRSFFLHVASLIQFWPLLCIVLNIILPSLKSLKLFPAFWSSTKNCVHLYVNHAYYVSYQSSSVWITQLISRWMRRCDKERKWTQGEESNGKKGTIKGHNICKPGQTLLW
jgi:hypothetical protein